MHRLVCAAALLAGLSAAPDATAAASSTIAFTQGGALKVVHEDGTDLRELLPAGADAANPAISPDGRLVAAAVLDGDGVPAIAVVRADGRGEQVVGPGLRSGTRRLVAWRSPAWTPSGRLLAACLPAPGRGWEVCSLDPRGARGRMLSRCACMSAGGGSPELDVLPDGRTIVFHVYDRLRMLSIAGGGRSTLARAPGATPFAHPSAAPDGRSVAVAVGDGVSLVPLWGGPATVLPGPWRSPAFGPDGARLAVLTTQPGARGIWTVRRDGTDPRLVVSAAVDGFDRLDWSPGEGT